MCVCGGDGWVSDVVRMGRKVHVYIFLQRTADHDKGRNNFALSRRSEVQCERDALALVQLELGGPLVALHLDPVGR